MVVLPHNPVLFFDGVCNLCNRTVQMIIKRDRDNQFYFASLQSPKGNEVKDEVKTIYGTLPDSIILLKDGKYYLKSDAVLQVAKLIGGIYTIAILAYIVPRFVRNAIYDWVAKRRYKWFGKSDECVAPDKELVSRFLN